MPNRSYPGRRSRPVSLAPVLALAILAAGIAFAQQQLPATAPTPASVPATTEPAPAGDTAAGDEAVPDAPPPRPAAAKGSPQRFEPSEKVRPDFDVAFPVDI
jgi:hypothetical protein